MHLSFDRGDWGRTSGEIYLDRVLAPKWLPCRLLNPRFSLFRFYTIFLRDIYIFAGICLIAGIIHRSRFEQAMSIMRAG